MAIDSVLGYSTATETMPAERGDSVAALPTSDFLEERPKSWHLGMTELFLATVLLATTLGTLWLALQTSAFVPKFDDWPLLVPALTGHEPVNAAWYWSQLNEHRFSVARALLLVGFEFTGGDFRSGGFLNLLLLSLSSLAMIGAARQLRGRSSICDAVFPLLMLHWGQTHLFFLGATLTFGASLAFFYLALYVGLTGGANFSVRRAGMFSLCLLGMVVSGLIGLVLAAPLTFWLGGIALCRWRDRSTRLQSLALAGMALLIAAVMGAYFIDFAFSAPPPEASDAPAGWFAKLKGAGVISAMSLGWVGRKLPAVSAILALAASALAIVLALRSLQVQPKYRNQAMLIVAGLLGTAVLVVAVGRGRAFYSGEGLFSTTRYAAISIPFWVLSYLAVIRFGSPSLQHLVLPATFGLGLVVYSGHPLSLDDYPHDLEIMRAIREQEDALIRAVVGNAPRDQAAEAFFVHQNGYSTQDGVAWLRMLERRNLGPFALSERQIQHYVDWWPARTPVATLELGEDFVDRFLGSGWHLRGEPNPNPEARWTVGRTAQIRFRSDTYRPREIAFSVCPFIVPGKHDRQRVEFVLNGVPLETRVFDSPGWNETTIKLPQSVLQDRNTLNLRLLDAAAPKDVATDNGDPRPLGLFVKSMRLD